MRGRLILTGISEHASGVEDLLRGTRPLCVHNAGSVLLHRRHLKNNAHIFCMVAFCTPTVTRDHMAFLDGTIPFP